MVEKGEWKRPSVRRRKGARLLENNTGWLVVHFGSSRRTSPPKNPKVFREKDILEGEDPANTILIVEKKITFSLTISFSAEEKDFSFKGEKRSRRPSLYSPSLCGISCPGAEGGGNALGLG